MKGATGKPDNGKSDNEHDGSGGDTGNGDAPVHRDANETGSDEDEDEGDGGAFALDSLVGLLKQQISGSSFLADNPASGRSFFDIAREQEEQRLQQEQHDQAPREQEGPALIDCGDDSPGGRLGSHPEAGPEAGQEGAFSGSVNSRAGGDGDDNDNESEGESESESGQNSGGDASFGDASDDAELHQTGDIAAAVLNCSAGDIDLVASASTVRRCMR